MPVGSAAASVSGMAGKAGKGVRALAGFSEQRHAAFPDEIDGRPVAYRVPVNAYSVATNRHAGSLPDPRRPAT